MTALGGGHIGVPQFVEQLQHEQDSGKESGSRRCPEIIEGANENAPATRHQKQAHQAQSADQQQHRPRDQQPGHGQGCFQEPVRTHQGQLEEQIIVQEGSPWRFLLACLRFRQTAPAACRFRDQPMHSDKPYNRFDLGKQRFAAMARFNPLHQFADSSRSEPATQELESLKIDLEIGMCQWIEDSPLRRTVSIASSGQKADILPHLRQGQVLG